MGWWRHIIVLLQVDAMKVSVYHCVIAGWCNESERISLCHCRLMQWKWAWKSLRENTKISTSTTSRYSTTVCGLAYFHSYKYLVTLMVMSRFYPMNIQSRMPIPLDCAQQCLYCFLVIYLKVVTNRKTNTNRYPDSNRYKRACPDPNARIRKFIH